MRYLIEGLALLVIGFTGRHFWLAYRPRVVNELLKSWPVKRRVVRAMHWPLVWRYAVQLGQTQTHNETGICLLCHATSRLAQDAHQPKDSIGYTVVCGRCGLPKNKWAKRCPGAPKRKFTAIQRQRFVAKQMFWN